MRKGEKRLFFGVLAILLAALLLLLVQWARGGNTPKVYHVSVLLDGRDNDYWKNFRAGMNQAALEQNIDLRFLTKYEGETTQPSALRAEWEGEADGVVIVPVDAVALSETLKDAPAGLVVGVVGPRLDSDRVDCYLAPDYVKVGRRLAEAAVQTGASGGCTVYLSPTASSAAEEIAADLKESLEGGAGRVVGMGVSSRLLHYLEDGTAAALVVQGDYDTGYLAVSRVARRLAGGRAEDSELEVYTATGENMFEYPMIDILFATY